MAYTWESFLNIGLSIGGIIFLVLASIVIVKIKKMFPGARVIKKWLLIQILIILFLVGYIMNIAFILMELTQILLVMTAIVYIFGGFFVYLIINLSYKTYKVFIEEAEK